MQKFISYFNEFLTLVSVVLPFIYFISFAKQGKAYKIFTMYLFFIAIIQGVMYYLTSQNIPNLYLFQYYFIGQFIFLSLFYWQLLKTWMVLLVLGMILGALGIQYFLSPSSFEAYNSIGVVVTQSVIVVYAMLFYYKMLSRKGSFLIINNGIFLYLIASVLFFSSGNLILKLGLKKETMHLIGIINDFSYFVLIVFILVEWWQNFRPKPIRK